MDTKRRSLEHLATQFRSGQLDRRSFLRAALAVGGVAFLPSILATACAPTASPQGSAAASATGGTVVVATGTEPGSLEASLNLGTDTIKWLHHLYDQLIMLDWTVEAPKALPFIPGLATSWTVSPDRLEYTFKLRQGVTFHDGTPFDAEAVKFNIERLTKKDHPYYYAKGAGSVSALFGKVASMEVVDPGTIKIKLGAPYSDFEDHLTLNLASIQSPANVKKYGAEDQGDHPSGTGPFKFVEKQAGTKLVLEKNPSYWAGAPTIDRIVVRPIPEPSARLSALEAGEIQIAVDLPPDVVERVKKNPALDVRTADLMRCECWMFNLKEKPFDDVRVRRALNYAVDRETYVRDILKGLGVAAKGVFSPSSPAYNSSLKGYTYDPERAKSLLKDAGLEKGFSFTVVTVERSGRAAVGQYIQNALKALNITMKVDVIDSVALSGMANKEGTKAGTAGYIWGWNIDPMFNVHRFFTSSFAPPKGVNWNYYKNPEVDRLLAEEAKATGREQRIDLYQKVESIVVDDAPWLFELHPFEARGYNKKLVWTSAVTDKFTLRNAKLQP